MFTSVDVDTWRQAEPHSPSCEVEASRGTARCVDVFCFVVLFCVFFLCCRPHQLESTGLQDVRVTPSNFCPNKNPYCGDVHFGKQATHGVTGGLAECCPSHYTPADKSMVDVTVGDERAESRILEQPNQPRKMAVQKRHLVSALRWGTRTRQLSTGREKAITAAPGSMPSSGAGKVRDHVSLAAIIHSAYVALQLLV